MTHYKTHFAWLAGVLLLAAATVLDAAPLKDPLTIQGGLIFGTLIDDPQQPVRIYRGVPYAEPPVGELRWKEARPAAPWEGVLEATQLGPWAVQPHPTPAVFEVKTAEGMSEDSLHVNVLTPAENSTDKLPVMVWLHGGGLDILSGNMERYNTADLPAKGAIVVTVNHRLGPMGYLAHPWLGAESPYGSSGHYGNLDIILALHWVHENIGAFGGDRDRVTVFGQSGGGRKVNFLMTSPLVPDGYVSRAISMSSSIHSIPLEEAEQQGLALTRELGVKNLAELRNTPWTDIIAAAEKIDWSGQMVVDGWALEQPITEAFAEGKQMDVPFMMGMVKTEDAGHFNVPVDVVPSIEQKESPVYAYVFDAVPTGWEEEGVKGWHAIDMAYLFGDARSNFENAKKEYVGAYVLRQGTKQTDPGFTKADAAFADTFQALWVEFAKTGKPSLPGTVDWSAYTEENDLYLQLDKDLEVKKGLSRLQHGQ